MERGRLSNQSRSRQFILAICIVGGLLAVDIGLRFNEVLRPKEVHGQADDKATRLARRRDSTVRAAMRAGQAIANISTEQRIKRRDIFRPDSFDRYYGWFKRDRSRKNRSLGSGIIIDPTGYILTNAHVVVEASRIIVTLPDDSAYEAQLVSFSEQEDLALLKVNAGKNLPTLKFGSSKELMIGETVLALGNPFGLENSVTRGVISARGRRIVREGKTLPGTFLQTDAAINPGNSGGALINIDAELIGMNTAVHTTGQGIGFAIPIDRIKLVLFQMSHPEKNSATWLGFLLEERSDQVLVKAVEENSPADKANLAIGDQLFSLGGRRMRSIFDIHKVIIERSSDAPINLEIQRGGKIYVTSLVPQLKPEVVYVREKLGFEGHTLQLGEAITRKLAIRKGIIVRKVRPKTLASGLGLQINDIVTKVEVVVRGAQKRRFVSKAIDLKSINDLATLLKRIPAGQTLSLYIVRKGRALVGQIVLK